MLLFNEDTRIEIPKQKQSLLFSYNKDQVTFLIKVTCISSIGPTITEEH